MEVSEINVAIEQIASGETTIEQIGETLMAIDNKVKFWKEISKAFELALFEHIKATGEPITIGDTLYKIGNPKKVEERDKSHAETVAALLESGGPDLLTQALGSGCWKHGTIEKMEQIDFARLFNITYEPELVEGKPNKKLMKLNTNFIK